MSDAFRRITTEQAQALKPGDLVAVRYFDPNGSKRDRASDMTTDEGVVTRIDGDPLSSYDRTVWVRPLDCSALHLNYFGRDLYVRVSGFDALSLSEIASMP